MYLYLYVSVFACLMPKEITAFNYVFQYYLDEMIVLTGGPATEKEKSALEHKFYKPPVTHEEQHV